MASSTHLHPQQNIRTIVSELDAFLVDAEDRRGLSANTLASYRCDLLAVGTLLTAPKDADFSFIGAPSATEYFRLTHPHLSDAIYRAIRARADEVVYTRDLSNAFSKALESDPVVAQRLLAAVVESHDRLDLVNESDLVEYMAGSWTSHNGDEKFSNNELAFIWTDWAQLTSRHPRVAAYFGGDSAFDRARSLIANGYGTWGVLWERLWNCSADNTVLVVDAIIRLRGTREDQSWSVDFKRIVTRLSQSGYGAELSGILVLGWERLRGIEALSEWAFIWQVLVDHHDHLLNEVSTAAVLVLGRDWLTRPNNNSRPEWTFVWSKYIKANRQLMGEWPLEDLMIGRRWLDGREDQPGWPFIWEVLVDARDNLSRTVPIDDLLALGRSWLNGRDDSAGWPHVWERLIRWGSRLPGKNLSNLLTLGYRWLAGREERPDWNYVWQKLVALRSKLPDEIPVQEVLRLGYRWLAGREERPDWNYVWQKLIAEQSHLPSDVSFSELLRIGYRWLAGRQDRSDWSYVYQKLLDLQSEWPDDMDSYRTREKAYSWLLDQGLRWFRNKENYEHPGWTHLGRTLIKQDLPLLTIDELLRHCRNWLDHHEDAPE